MKKLARFRVNLKDLRLRPEMKLFFECDPDTLTISDAGKTAWVADADGSIMNWIIYGAYPHTPVNDEAKALVKSVYAYFALRWDQP